MKMHYLVDLFNTIETMAPKRFTPMRWWAFCTTLIGITLTSFGSTIPPMSAYFPLDEGQGTVVTEVINGVKGELVNADTTTAWITGKVGGALRLDGVDDRVFVPHHPGFDFADESFSVSFQMRWPKGREVYTDRFFTKGDYSSSEPGQTGKRWELYISNHKNMTFVIDDDGEHGSSRLKVPLAPYITGEWVHVVAVRDTNDKQLRLYANGVLQKSIEPNNPRSNGIDITGSISNPQRLTIGDAFVLDAPFDGDLDDIRIFRCALTEQQIAALASCPATSSTQQQLAFPTAEGYGKYTVGGRGGKVYEVTNLNDSGEGSLRAAIEAERPRTVVFRVSGTIDADLKIKNDFITIAGQTAPGDGITIKGQLGISANEVIIRYIRVRAEGRGDAISGRYNKNVIIDHVSTSWSSDEVFTIYHGEYVTIQWCMITEGCGGSHKFGGIWGNNHGTYHHNLIAHNLSRNPRFASGGGYNDYRNNVTYNWKIQTVYGGEKQQPTRASSQHEKNKTKSHFAVNIVANYFKPGPGTQPDRKNRICSPWSRNGADDYGRWYVADNVVVGSPEVTADNWKGVFPKDEKTDVDLDAIPGLKLDKPIDFMPIKQQTAEAAYQSVLEHAGCSLPRRDAIDLGIIEDVRNGTGTKGDNGFVSNPKVAGGWPELKSTPAPTDTDHDGMPDEWETKQGLDPNDATDGNKVATDGYTMLEKYLNSIK